MGVVAIKTSVLWTFYGQTSPVSDQSFWQKHITLKRICSIAGVFRGPIKTYFRLQRGHSNAKSCSISAAHFVYLDVLCQKSQDVLIGYEVFIVQLTDANYLIIKSTGLEIVRVLKRRARVTAKGVSSMTSYEKHITVNRLFGGKINDSSSA